MVRRSLAASLAALLLAAVPVRAEEKPAAEAQKAWPKGLAAFSALPRYAGASISPKGTTLAVISLEKGRRTLVLMNLATRKFSTVRPGGESMIGRVHWVDDTRLVAELVDQEGWLSRPLPTGELYAVNADGTGGTRIYGYRAGRAGEEASRVRGARREMAGGRVVSVIRNDPGKVLVESYDFRSPGDTMARLVTVDAYTGASADVTQGPLPNLSYLADADGVPRLAQTQNLDLKRRAFYLDPEKGWIDLAKRPGFGEHPAPIAFLAKDRTVQLVEPIGGGFGVFSVSVETGERKLLVKTSTAVPDALLRERDTGRLLAVVSVPDLPVIDYVDPKHPICQVLAGLEEAYPGQHPWPVSRTDDGKLAVVALGGDRHPLQWLLVDVAKRSAEPILNSHPWIDPEQMAEMSAFHIAASDGFKIHGYLTMPPGLAPGAPAPPMVVHPHGGPHGVRDEWGFNPEVQLLANQGFAVLQVNFRGSGGYGDDYQERGYRHWGDRMMQDVVDATRWAVKKGKADPKRICLYGASFGGYTALQAPLVAPDLFRCTAGYVGVYDLTLMSRSGDISWSRFGRGFLKVVIGEDEAELKAMSPLYQADKLKLPILLIHGKHDLRVPIEHAEKLREALIKAGRPPGWLVETDEGHGFYDEGRRENMYRRLVEFLKENTKV